MDRSLHRRQSPRLSLGVEAEFICIGGRQQVLLQDISATGAKLERLHRQPTANGFLRWMDFEVFGDIQWRGAGRCGIVFDRPLSTACLIQTRSAAPGVLREQQRNANSHARYFVLGSPD